MNDQDIIQRNQIVIMRALARIGIDMTTAHSADRSNEFWDAVNGLFHASIATQEHLDWKLNKTTSASLDAAAKATEENVWPKDLEKPE